MARRKKGRKVHGWLVIDKPAGVTSTSMVNKARWAFGAQKAGHAGTLDPAATGVLAIAFGEATKTIPYITDALKAYRFTVTWGAATPPKFSAVKVNGERAYALARDGEDVELKSRPLFVESLKLVEQPDADHVTLEMVCGKGGYVRSIARDLGEVLGCLGHVQLDQYLLPVEAGLNDLPEQKIKAEGAAKLRNGNPGPVAYSDLEFGEECWVSCDGVPVAVGTYRAGHVAPSKVFVFPRVGC